MAASSMVSSPSVGHHLLFPPVIGSQTLRFSPQRSGDGPKIRIPHSQKVGPLRNLGRICAVGGRGASTTGVPTSVPVRVAFELLQAGHRYLDVRTPEEFSAGHTPGATNVPYLFRFGSGMTKNPHFLEEVSSHFGKDDEIIVGCQKGKRSLVAATDLLSAGFTGITDMAGGYATWVENELPVES